MINSVLNGCMTINEVRQKREIWYHGTTSIYLDSILKVGLDAERNKGEGFTERVDGIEFRGYDIDRPKKDWSSKDPVISIFPGIYLSKDPSLAIYGCNFSVLRHGGSALVVSVSLDTQSLYADEDTIQNFVNIFPVSEKKAFDILVSGDIYGREYESFISKTLSSLRYDGLKRLNNDLYRKNATNNLRDFWRSLVHRLAFYYYRDIISEKNNKYAYLFKSLSEYEVENEFRRSYEMLTRFFNSVVDSNSYRSRGGYSGRYPRSISYRGSTKIVAVTGLDVGHTVIDFYGNSPQKLKESILSIANKRIQDYSHL